MEEPYSIHLPINFPELKAKCWATTIVNVVYAVMKNSFASQEQQMNVGKEAALRSTATMTIAHVGSCGCRLPRLGDEALARRSLGSIADVGLMEKIAVPAVVVVSIHCQRVDCYCEPAESTWSANLCPETPHCGEVNEHMIGEKFGEHPVQKGWRRSGVFRVLDALPSSLCSTESSDS